MAKTTETYLASRFGEEELMNLFHQQRDDAKAYFINCIKPRLDRSYKLYIGDNRDRAKEIQSWQSNIVVPYIHAVVETLKPRILDARPSFVVQGRNEDDQLKAPRLQSLCDYTWEISHADTAMEDVTSSCLTYGMGYFQVSYKKDVRTHKFLKTKDIGRKKFEWEKRTQTFYDAPYVEWVDNYSLWYDWHNVSGKSKQYWFKRLVLSDVEIKRRYPMADKVKLAMALATPGGDMADYASVRNEVKLAHEKIVKGSDYNAKNSLISSSSSSSIYQSSDTLKMYEVFERWRPLDDDFTVVVSDVPIFKNGSMPNPYDFKESVFIGIPYLRLPGEYEGYGVPMILENPAIMLNMTKNQRLDAMTLNIHKMWIVNPLANINKADLVARPFGIIYSVDPNGVREVQTSDIKPSAYKEEDLLKSDMRYASGVDDFSMGVGGGSSSATEVRHLRESTLERVRLFVNHIGEGLSEVQRYWISMWRQFYTKDIIIRITGENGNVEFPLIEKDDLEGEFDFISTVIPSIAGMNDVKKKQDMDLFQLLIALPFIDPEKLTSKVLHDWNWNLESIKKVLEEAQPQTPEELEAALSGQPVPPEQGGMMPEGMPLKTRTVPADIMASALDKLGGPGAGSAFLGEANRTSPIAEMGAPVNLLRGNSVPPTARGIGGTTNPRGLNRKVGGKVNTNISTKQTSNPESNLMNRVFNVQK